MAQKASFFVFEGWYLEECLQHARVVFLWVPGIATEALISGEKNAGRMRRRDRYGNYNRVYPVTAAAESKAAGEEYYEYRSTPAECPSPPQRNSRAIRKRATQ